MTTRQGGKKQPNNHCFKMTSNHKNNDKTTSVEINAITKLNLLIDGDDDDIMAKMSTTIVTKLMTEICGLEQHHFKLHELT